MDNCVEDYRRWTAIAQLHSAGWLLNRLKLTQERLFGFQHVREIPNKEWLSVTLKTAFETTLAETIKPPQPCAVLSIQTNPVTPTHHAVGFHCSVAHSAEATVQDARLLEGTELLQERSGPDHHQVFWQV